MGSYRKDRINEDAKKELSIIINTLKDPRIPQFSSVTSVNITPDLKHAKIFISIMGNEEQKNEGMKGINSAAGFIRKELGSKMRLRIVPELHFELDNSLENAVKINELLTKLNIPKDDDDVFKK